MKHSVLLTAFIFVLVSISGCASVAPPRTEYNKMPPLEKGWSRIFISSGQYDTGGPFKPDLKSKHQTGPVYINDQKVGSAAYKEYFAVDLLPGSYEAYWAPDELERFFSVKKAITLKAGEIRYFNCDIAPRVGMYFGLVGALVSQYSLDGLLTEKPSLDSESKLVAYLKFNGSSSSSMSESVVNHLNAEVAPANVSTNESVAQKLRDLQALRKDGVITEDEFQKKKQQLLEKL